MWPLNHPSHDRTLKIHLARVSCGPPSSRGNGSSVQAHRPSKTCTNGTKVLDNVSICLGNRAMATLPPSGSFSSSQAVRCRHEHPPPNETMTTTHPAFLRRAIVLGQRPGTGAAGEPQELRPRAGSGRNDSSTWTALPGLAPSLVHGKDRPGIHWTGGG
jgi:hypothetical protein